MSCAAARSSPFYGCRGDSRQANALAWQAAGPAPCLFVALAGALNGISAVHRDPLVLTARASEAKVKHTVAIMQGLMCSGLCPAVQGCSASRLMRRPLHPPIHSNRAERLPPTQARQPPAAAGAIRARRARACTTHCGGSPLSVTSQGISDARTRCARSSAPRPPPASRPPGPQGCAATAAAPAPRSGP